MQTARACFALGLSLKLLRPGACRAVFLGFVKPEADALGRQDQRYARIVDRLERAVSDRTPCCLAARTGQGGPFSDPIAETSHVGFSAGLSRAPSSAIVCCCLRRAHRYSPLRLLIVPERIRPFLR